MNPDQGLLAEPEKSDDGQKPEIRLLRRPRLPQQALIGVVDRTRASAWAYAPLTVVADVPLMTFGVFIQAPLLLFGALP